MQRKGAAERRAPPGGTGAAAASRGHTHHDVEEQAGDEAHAEADEALRSSRDTP